VKSTVQVTANEELINVTTADVTNVVNSQSVEELPLNGRDPSSLVLLSPGVVNLSTSGFAQSTSQGTNSLGSVGGLQLEATFSTGGGRQGSTYFLLDGAPNMDAYLETGLPNPNADATKEFRVLTQNFDAQYGFSVGGVVTIQTKSGTNAFHGGLFEFIRNNDLNAADYFAKTKNLLKRNQFGGFVGGPILRDKFFFFASFQDTRTNATVNTGIIDTPTAAMLSGDFSAVTNLSSHATSQGFVLNGTGGGTINPALFNPTMLALTKIALPLGQNAETGQVGYSEPPSADTYAENVERLDYTINAKNNLFLRSYILYLKDSGGDVKGDILAVNDGQTGEDYNEALGWSSVINDTMVNNLTFSFLEEDTLAEQVAQTSDGADFCWSKYIDIVEPAGLCYLEGADMGGSWSNWTEPIAQRRTTWGLSDTLSKTMGDLTISTGADVHRQFSQEATEYPQAPIVVFSGAYTGNGFADLLLGDLDNYQQGGGELTPLKGYQLGVYGQAQYRVKPNLTVTAGVRWDPNLPPAEVGGRGSVFEPGAQSVVYPNAPTGMLFPGDPGVKAGLMPTDLSILEPRVGAVWQPGFLPHTAIRAGFGQFSGPILYNYYNHFVDIPPFSPYYNFSPTFDNAGNLTNGINASEPWTASSATGSPGHDPFVAPYGAFASIGVKPPSNFAFSLPVTLGGSFAPDFRTSITTSWSISIEQQLGRDFAVHIAYVGNHADRTMVLVDENAGDINPSHSTFGQRVTYSTGEYATAGVPDYGEVYVDQSVGTSAYNSLQLGVDKKISHGIQFQSNFTWQKLTDDTGIGSVPIPNPYNIAANKSISTFNLPLSWVSNFVYTSPSLSGQNLLVKELGGSWRISSIYTLQSGAPFSIGGDADGISSGSTEGGETAYKVKGVATDVHSGGKAHWLQQYINPAAFTTNPAGTFGDSRNVFHTPRLNYADSALSKTWTARERYGFQLRFDFFNTFNHASFGAPDSGIGDGGSWNSAGTVWTPNPAGNFGHITSSGNEPAREIQGALKFTF
jgi:hypothetical protein